MNEPARAPADAFFLDTQGGRRFCLYHAPIGECRGALVYVHPFAEEMNRSRRMAALQARALAARGIGVLQLDLHGCGDSVGDFGDATGMAGCATSHSRAPGSKKSWAARLACGDCAWALCWRFATPSARPFRRNVCCCGNR
ncbi:hypothetical protein [Massilia sp. Se16.2.3]|uniref:hypothetical protein n=1 Tax=Massilia sp. Se16.2.3 TaxID=2709303 RepID=UPI001E45A885|nr:hypothetical protein [Massilia sp. Se16.2.3]